jgi:hypothetical protein
VSLTSPIPNARGVVFSATGLPCFFCGEALADPALHWMGVTADVYLHPACWPRLATRLFRDLHELENPDYYQRRREGKEAT